MVSPLRAPPPADALMERLLPLVGAWCARLAPPGVDAESAAHDALLVALRRREDLRPDAPVEPWAWGITVRVIRAHRRRAWLRRWLPGDVPEGRSGADPARSAERRELAEQVRSVLQRLSDAHREVLVLCDVEERARAEVAQILGLPEGTVGSRLRLARRAFREEATRQNLAFVQGLGGDDA